MAALVGRLEGMDEIGPVAGVDLRLHRIVRQDLIPQILPGPPLHARPALTCLVTRVSGPRVWVGLEEGPRPVLGRRPFPEDEIAEACDLEADQGRIRLTRPLEFTDVEVFTVMQKVLVHAVSPPIGGRWMMVRYAVNPYREHTAARQFEVQLAEEIRHGVATSVLRSTGEDCGHISFAFATEAA